MKYKKWKKLTVFFTTFDNWIVIDQNNLFCIKSLPKFVFNFTEILLLWVVNKQEGMVLLWGLFYSLCVKWSSVLKYIHELDDTGARSY